MSKNLKYGIPTARLEFLRNVPMFEGLQDETLARIDSQLDEVDVASGRVLTGEGGAAGEAFIIEAGTAEVSIGGEVVGKTTVGEMIGEVGVINHTPRSATVVAVNPMRLLAIHPRQMSWLFEDSVLAKRIEENLAKHTANAD